MTTPLAGLFLCEHWRCWLSPRACAARHRAANRRRRWGPSPTEGTYSSAAMDTHCKDCEIGRENARMEDEMKKKKNKQPPPAAAKPAPPTPPPPPGLSFFWLDMIGEPLVEEFLLDAEESGRTPAEHLRHVVAEYYYLRELGA